YKDLAGQVWEPSVEVPDGGDGDTDPEPPSGEGRAWIELKGGSKNGGGHAYGDASKAAPVLLLDNDKKMEESGELSLAVKPSCNWGVFYTYVNDNNWLYVGYDPSSKWYYQYKLNGEESYPGIPGLPTPVEGEELQMSISLNRETLSVTVNGVTQRVTNQSLIKFSEQNAGKCFGVKTTVQQQFLLPTLNTEKKTVWKTNGYSVQSVMDRVLRKHIRNLYHLQVLLRKKEKVHWLMQPFVWEISLQQLMQMENISLTD
ncbi:MAG: hypothetical protein ACLTCI_10745, partial [[Clostridium] nexile]